LAIAGEHESEQKKADLMATLGPKCYSFVASCNGIEMRLRVDPGASWLTIKRPGRERDYRDIPEGQTAATVEQFLAIGEDPQKFKAFIGTLPNLI
jgi:hypothetical protein